MITENFAKSMGLFAVPSFFRGFARALDLGATFDVYNESANGAIADLRAIQSDWQQVGLDLYAAMEQYEYEAQ